MISSDQECLFKNLFVINKGTTPWHGHGFFITGVVDLESGMRIVPLFYSNLCFFHNTFCHHHDQANIQQKSFATYQHLPSTSYMDLFGQQSIAPPHPRWAEARMCNIHVNNGNKWNAQKEHAAVTWKDSSPPWGPINHIFPMDRNCIK